MTAVDFLAERYNYITWMRNRDEISAGTADEWRDKFLKEAKEMEEQQLNKAWQEGAVTGQIIESVTTTKIKLLAAILRGEDI